MNTQIGLVWMQGLLDLSDPRNDQTDGAIIVRVGGELYMTQRVGLVWMQGLLDLSNLGNERVIRLMGRELGEEVSQ